MLGSLRREERPPSSSSAAPFCSGGSSSSSDSIRSEAWRNALFSVPMLTKAAWIPGNTASTVPRWMSPTMRRASGRSTRSSARRSSSRMATRVSRGLPLIRISRFKAGSLGAGRPAAARRPVIDATRVLSGRGTGRGDEPEQPIGLVCSESPMHTLNLSGLATYVNNPEISAVPARRHAPHREGLVLVAMLLSGAGTTPAAQTIQYPTARKGDVVDDYHGTKVPDPYRWLEDVEASETRAWIEAENRVTDAYLAQIGERDGIRRRLTALWNYPRYGPPFKKAGRYFFFKNDGLQNQSVLYRQASRGAEPEALLDPNTFSADGTVALATLALSEDGRQLAYGTAASGSDWVEFRVRDVESGRDRPDHVKWVKFSDASWTHDGAGFLYSRYPEPAGENPLLAENRFQKLYYHRLGTDLDAPRKRVVAIDTRHPERARWREVIPQGEDVIELVSIIHDSFVASYLHDAHSRVRLFRLDGRFVKDVELPTLGSITQITGERKDDEMFFGFTSFLYPTTIFRYDFATGDTSVFKAPSIDFDPTKYETRQVFYTSKDGTRVPMFITHRKGLQLDGSNPTYLRGYGGFNVSETPAFAVSVVVWLEMGGVYAVPNLRGGGEYGEEWHQAGMHEKKQNVFDDFIAAAEYLIGQRYTSPAKLAIAGGSNGGLLVGAVMTQRPELFGAALPAVGVMDMLRFHRFTIGWPGSRSTARRTARSSSPTCPGTRPITTSGRGRAIPPR